MPTNTFLAILVIGGYILGALTIMALLLWVLVLLFARRVRRNGPNPAARQSVATANSLFELSGPTDDLFESAKADALSADAQPGGRSRSERQHERHME